MIKSYGEPPDSKDCVDASPPDNLVLVHGPNSFQPHMQDMFPWMRKPVSDVAIARQLNRAFEFGRDQPVRVQVPQRGTFLLGPEGWCVQ